MVNWGNAIKNTIIYSGLVAAGYGMRSGGDGISTIDRVEFPGGDKGIVLVRRFCDDMPFVDDSKGSYQHYDEKELMRRATKDEGGK